MLNKIRIVLVETSHSGNIGSAARAMMNMSLSDLYLVNPRSRPDEHANAVASHAESLVSQAHVVGCLEDALDGVDFVIGTSARVRKMDLPMVCSSDSASEAIDRVTKGRRVAIVFGRERTGLYNNELLMCHIHAYIPTNELYNSLNLAQAVQVFCYEIFCKHLQVEDKSTLPEPNHLPQKASAKELNGLYGHLESSFVASGFLDPKKPGHVVDKLRRLFQRAQLESQEVNILRGFLTSLDDNK